jgi:hypothetical protein
MTFKTLHRKLKIEQNEPHKKLGVNSGRINIQHITVSHGTMGDGAMRHCYMLDVPWEMVP